MRFFRRSYATIVLAALTLSIGCATLDLPSPPNPFSAGPAPGTKDWWRNNKRKATFDPQKGYRVAGVDGYFDQDGRPINSQVAKVIDKKDKSGGLLGDVEFTSAVDDLKEQVGLGPDQTEAQKAFAAGEELFRAEKYGEAAKQFKKAASNAPDTPMEQDALFQLAESYFFGDDYSYANDAYEQLLRKYPNTPHLDNVVTRQFSIARYWEQYQDYNPNWVTTPNIIDGKRPLFDTLGRAMKVYENIRMNDPTGPLADDAIMATANSYFRRGRFNDADYQYDLLRKEYPRSDHQYNAYVLGLQCKLRRYQGPDYDGTPLEEAQQLAKQQKMIFARELSPEERQRLTEIDAQVTRELATRDYDMAERFAKLDQNGSAKFYLAQVVKKYPNTPVADQARTRLAELGGLPEQPVSKVAWIIDKLPESAERRAVRQVPLIQNANPLQLEPPGAGDVMQAQNPGDDAGGPTVTR